MPELVRSFKPLSARLTLRLPEWAWDALRRAAAETNLQPDELIEEVMRWYADAARYAPMAYGDDDVVASSPPALAGTVLLRRIPAASREEGDETRL